MRAGPLSPTLSLKGRGRSDSAVTGVLDRVGLVLVVLLPWLLVHARAGSEVAIDLVAASFLVRCVTGGGWGWVRRLWVGLAFAWWGWLILATLLNLGHEGAGLLLQAVGFGRFLLFVAALEQWVLRDPAARRWFFCSLGLATFYVAAQTLLQFGTGHNLFGDPRSGDGELTGPFDKPRDAPTFVRMLFPVLLPPAHRLLVRPEWRARAAGAALVIAAMAVTVLIGQRMPVLLAVLGLVLAGLLLRRLRGPVIAAVLLGAGLVAASAALSPPTFYRLVTKFSQQMGHFAESPYGLIAERAVAIAEQHPWTGRGYDGYRVACPEPVYFQAWHWPGQQASADPIGASLCLNHTHNLYLQAVTDAGLPGLLLFGALAVTWLWRLARPAGGMDPLGVGLFVAVFIQLWPIASTSPLTSLPIGGWFFLLLGAGLARAAPPEPASIPPPA